MKLVSVLLPVYNAENTLTEAIESIINQTYTNWELVMCDDGSEDNSFEIMQSFAMKYPCKIVVLKNEINLGLNATLNRCLAFAKGEYIARMDSDDKSILNRFEKQVHFLDTHKEKYFVSSTMIHFSNTDTWCQGKTIEYPTIDDVISGSPICHAPVMIRKNALLEVNGYSIDWWTKRVEDVNLWIKLYSKGYKCYNFKEPLYMVRDDLKAFNRRKYRYRVNSTITRLYGCVLLKASIKSYAKAFKPMIVGLIPNRIRFIIRNKMKIGVKKINQ